MTALAESRLPLPLLRRGKVREVYEVDAAHLLLVASDRVSAFDIVMREPIPRKGAVLTQMSAFWFERTRHIAPNHLLQVDGARMIGRKAQRIDVECVARGYLAGSGWADYRRERVLEDPRAYRIISHAPA